jgi:hypothetical protein
MEAPVSERVRAARAKGFFMMIGRSVRPNGRRGSSVDCRRHTYATKIVEQKSGGWAADRDMCSYMDT